MQVLVYCHTDHPHKETRFERLSTLRSHDSLSPSGPGQIRSLTTSQLALRRWKECSSPVWWQIVFSKCSRSKENCRLSATHPETDGARQVSPSRQRHVWWGDRTSRIFGRLLWCFHSGYIGMFCTSKRRHQSFLCIAPQRGRLRRARMEVTVRIPSRLPHQCVTL